MYKLPVPSDQKASEEISNDDNQKIKKALNIETKEIKDSSKNSNNKKTLEELILEKINN